MSYKNFFTSKMVEAPPEKVVKKNGANNGKVKKAPEPKMVEELTFHEEMPADEIK